ncbi:Bax inhibitor-1/YccA family protein [Falsiporphyromonas endometrii]|uniref:Bax inhibitor-1/YccA family protein n=1 Tax=Falsiporphyromonas endometrii TaxID=1387297 RepID=A0ABV9K5E1_9PORP
MQFNEGMNEYSGQSQNVVTSTTTSSLMRSVFIWMTLALGITGFTSYLMMEKGYAMTLLQSGPMLFFGLLIAELIMVFVLSARIMKMSFSTATICFAAYSILNGVTLSPLLMMYTKTSLTTTFFITAGTFLAMAVIGYTTKRDLTKMGSYLFMGLIGLIIASVVNIFLGNSMFDLIISVIGVLIFTGLTVYEVNRIKAMLSMAVEGDETFKKIALLGSLSLYLDFINLFLYILRFFGNRD